MSNTTETLNTKYEKLMALTKEIVTLYSATGIVYWDMETMMPPKGVNLRSQQLAVLSQMTHRLSTKPEIGTLLKNIERQ